MEKLMLSVIFAASGLRPTAQVSTEVSNSIGIDYLGNTAGLFREIDSNGRTVMIYESLDRPVNLASELAAGLYTVASVSGKSWNLSSSLFGNGA